MKTVKTLLIILTLNSTMIAQDNNYSGPAKFEVKIFWAQIDKIKKTNGGVSEIKNAEKALADAKQKDPALTTNSMEEELNKWKNGTAKVNNDDNKKTSNAIQPDDSYTGPAKMYVTNATKQINEANTNIQKKLYTNAENKLELAEKSITQIKAKDASYNTAPMEAEIKKLKVNMEATLKEEGDGKEAKNEKNRQITQMFNDVTRCVQIPIPHEEKEITDFKNRVKSILERKETLAAFKESYKDDAYLETLVNELKSGSDVPLNREINNVVLIINSPYGNASSEESDFKATCNKILGIQAYWEAALQMFPEISECGEAVKKCSELTNKYGTVEKIKAISKANLVTEIKSRKLPTAIVKDAKLEQIFIDGFNKKYGPAYNAKAVKVVLTQDGWTTERHPITGIIVGRKRTGKIAYKTTEGDGKCYLLSNNIYIYEEYIGGSFTNTQVTYNGLGGDEMLCENIK